MKLWHAVWFWQTIHCEAIQEVLVTTTQIKIPRMELSKVSGDYERWIAAGKKPLSEK